MARAPGYSVQYKKEHYKRIPLEVKCDEYEEIKEAAQSVSEPVNTYIKSAVRMRMESEKKK